MGKSSRPRFLRGVSENPTAWRAQRSSFPGSSPLGTHSHGPPQRSLLITLKIYETSARNHAQTSGMFVLLAPEVDNGKDRSILACIRQIVSLKSLSDVRWFPMLSSFQRCMISDTLPYQENVGFTLRGSVKCKGGDPGSGRASGGGEYWSCSLLAQKFGDGSRDTVSPAGYNRPNQEPPLGEPYQIWTVTS